MTVDAAIALSTLLAVVWLAFMLEAGRLIRAANAKHMPQGRLSLMIISSSFLIEEVALLYVINTGGAEGFYAGFAWGGAAAVLALMTWMFVWSLVRKD